MTRSNYITTLCTEVEEILFWKSRSKWRGGGVPSSNDGCEIFKRGLHHVSYILLLTIIQCGEVFSQILKNLEKNMTTKAGIALAGQIQNRSSQNIIPFVKVALDQRSSKLNIISIVKNS